MALLAGLSRAEKATCLSAFGGWMLDAFDYMIFTFVITTLIGLWHISAASAGALVTVTLLFSSIGGWGAGILADRFGRVRLLQASILWFSVCTFLIGFCQNFTQLFIVRTLQGIGFGGEWAVGSVLVGEIVRAEHRGKAVGLIQSGWAVGWGAAALFYALAFSLLSADTAWRSLFWIGILPAFLVLYVRRHVPEPAAFKTVMAKRDHADTPPFWAIFSPSLFKTTALSALLCLGIQGGYYAITTWLPTYLEKEHGLSVIHTGEYLMVVIIGSFLGYVCGAFLADLWGRKPTFSFFAVLSLCSVIAYLLLPLTNTQMLIAGFPLGFSASGIYSGLGAYLSELFPHALRANGQGFAYNFGRAMGAFFPGLIGFLSQAMGLGNAICAFAACAYGAVLLIVLCLPETKGKVLSAH